MHPFLPPSLRRFEPRHLIPGPGSRHVALEYDLAASLRPALVVDVGAGDATSFFTYCQAMREHDVPGSAYAFDAWDDPEPPAQATFEAIGSHGRHHYPGLHYLTRESPGGALRHFAPSSVDLLRVDPARLEAPSAATLAEAVERLRPGGVLVVHGPSEDAAREAWASIETHGRRVSFAAGRGLGLLRKSGGGAAHDELLRLLFESDQTAALERFYEHAREHLRLLRMLSRF